MCYNTEIPYIQTCRTDTATHPEVREKPYFRKYHCTLYHWGMLIFILPCSFFNELLRCWDIIPLWNQEEKNINQLTFPINNPCLRFKGSMLRLILPCSVFDELLRSWDIIPLWKEEKKTKHLSTYIPDKFSMPSTINSSKNWLSEIDLLDGK